MTRKRDTHRRAEAFCRRSLRAPRHGGAGYAAASRSSQRRERERLKKVATQRKQERWLSPSAASLQREHEYLAWLEAQAAADAGRRRAARNDTFEIFLTERRMAKEKERLLVAERRRVERHQFAGVVQPRNRVVVQREWSGLQSRPRPEYVACRAAAGRPYPY